MYKVVSLFSGCGGSSYGYTLAGMKVLAANEFVPAAVDTYKANFPNTILFDKDIRTLTGKEVLDAIGLKVGELDVLDGSPPCFIAGTLINTKRGFVPIEEIVVGDEVLTHKNRYRKVTTLMQKQYDGDMYEIACAGAESVLCTPEHPFYVKADKCKGLGDIQWKDAKDITLRDYLSIAVPTEEVDYVWNGIEYKTAFNRITRKFDRIENVNTLPVKSPDFWWLIGRWLGDGWCRYYESSPEDDKKNKRNRATFIICCSKLNNESKEITAVLDRLNFKYEVREMPTVCRVAVHKKELVMFAKQFGNRAYNKLIPKNVQELPINLQKSLLEGYYSADGTRKENEFGVRFEYASVSRQLIYGLNVLGLRVYKSCNRQITKRTRKKNQIICGRLCNVRPAWGHEIKTYKTGKQYNYVDDNNIAWSKCKKMNVVKMSCTVYNISVEEDESYTANNMIVHNCQSFSMSGLREEKWGEVRQYSDVTQRTDDLFDEFIRLVTEIQPKVFVAENVAGMAMGGAKPYFAKVFKGLENAGYKVSCRLLNAQYFNVPQHRPRLIWIGVRADLGVLPSHPGPQSKPMTLGDALNGVINTQADIDNASYPKHYSVIPLLNQMKPGENGAKYHPKGSYFSLRRLEFDKVCGTILQKDATHTSCSAVHPIENRRLTIPELRRVCSFPDDFIFTGNYGKQWERMGRAVPPNFMKAIAEHVRYRILDKINNIPNNYNPSVYNVNVEEDQTTLIGGGNSTSFKEVLPEISEIDSTEKIIPLI